MVPAELDAFLARELDVEVTATRVLADGLNLVLAVSTPGADPAYVVRSPRKLRESEVFVDLRTEHRVLERLAETPVPAPRPVRLCGADSPLGEPLSVVEPLAGEPFPWGERLPERYRTPASRDRIATATVETLAEIHALDTGPFADVCERVPASALVERTAARLDAVTETTRHGLPRLREVADRLRERAPVPGERPLTLTHGDFRPGNLLFAGPEPRLTGVLDWETPMLGDPLVEVGYLQLDWRGGNETEWPDPSALDVPPDADGMDRVRELNREGLTPFTTRRGSPSAAELAARYEAFAGRTFVDDGFYRALAAFGLGTVWADIERHAAETGGEEATEYLPAPAYLGLVALAALAD